MENTLALSLVVDVSCIRILCFVEPASRYHSCKLSTWRTVLFSYMFIPNLYMFRALMCSSSGELIVSIRHLVYVTLCRWPSGMFVWVPLEPGYQTVTYIQWHIPDVVFIQLILLMMSTWVLETCRDLEYTYSKIELCFELVIYKNVYVLYVTEATNQGTLNGHDDY